MNKRVLVVALLFSMAGSFATWSDRTPLPPGLAGLPQAEAIAARHPIFVVKHGGVDISIATARQVFDRPNLISDVQSTYAALLPPSEKPEFVVEQTASNAWYYVNKNDEESSVTELLRDIPVGGDATIAYLVKGERFFGDFDALIHIVVKGQPEDVACTYTATVWAWPHNRFARFFARHLGLVEKFFDSKTKDLAELSERVASHLCARELAQHTAR